MRFSARINDGTTIDLFVKMLQTMGKLSKLCALRIDENTVEFVLNNALRDTPHHVSLKLNVVSDALCLLRSVAWWSLLNDTQPDTQLAVI